MKKVLGFITAAMLMAANIGYGDQVSSYAVPQMVVEINAAINNPTSTTITVSGKTTCNGELEANKDVDFNFTRTNDWLRITQTNAAGAANTPMASIVDARTGANANSATEATLVITPSGTHAISVTAGITALQAVEGTTVTTTGLGTFPTLSVTGTVTIAEGMLTDSTIISADIKDGEIAAADLASDSVTSNNLINGDYGDVSVAANGTITLDADVVSTDEMADADHGAFTYASGVASLDADTVTSNNLINGDYGEVSIAANGTVTVDDGVIDDANIVDGSAFTFGGTTLTQTNGSFTGLNSFNLAIGYNATSFQLSNPTPGGMIAVISADDDVNADLYVQAGGSGVLYLGDQGSECVIRGISFISNEATTVIFTNDVTIGGDLTIAEGKLSDSSIVSGDIKDGDIANADLADDSVSSNKLLNGDYGDVSVAADGTITIDSGVVSSNDLVTGDYGDVSVAADGTITLDNDVVGEAEIDFANVTGADLTLTDCTAITASDDITANGNLIGDGSTVVSNMAAYYVGSVIGISGEITNYVEVTFATGQVITITGGLITGITQFP